MMPNERIEFVLLDGKKVFATEIDPAKHRYIGMFRPATNPFANATANVMCTCGEILQSNPATVRHYKQGCYDLNQYVSLTADLSIPFSQLWPDEFGKNQTTTVTTA